MGLNTEGEEICPGSIVTERLELTEETFEFEQDTTNEKNLPQDTVDGGGIEDQKPANGTGIPLISIPKMPLQSDVLNTETSEAQKEHRDGVDSVLCHMPPSIQHDADVEDGKTELAHGALVNYSTDTSTDDKCITLEEHTSSLQPAETMKILETDTNDALVHPEIDQMDTEGYTSLYKAALEGHLDGVDDLISRGSNPNKQIKNGLSPLHASCKKGDTHIVEYLILQGADVNVECELGQTPLHTASSNGSKCIVEILIAKGADMNKEDKTGWTPFNAAVQHGHLEAVKYLVSQGAEQNRHDGMTPLSAALEFDHLEVVEFFISNGADVNEEDDDGTIPLHGAAGSGYVDVMKYLIQHGSDINKSDVEGWTPFNAAVQNGHLEIVKYLMNEDVKQNRCGGMTPINAAAASGHLHIVEYFISKRADENEDHDKGIISLHGAAARGHMNFLEYLIQQGSDVNKEDAKGGTPFNAAVQYGHLKAVKYLVSQGAKQNRYDGMTPLYAAAEFGHLDIAEFFISTGADVNKEDEEGKIPLHGAAARGHLKVMKYLIQEGSDVNKVDSKGWTPFNAAVQYGHLEAVKYLVSQGAKQNRYDGMTQLYAAAEFGHLDIVTFFSSEGADVNEEDEEGKISLHGAADIGQPEVTQYPNMQGADDLSLKNLPTMSHIDEDGGNEEQIPFINTKPKSPDKNVQDSKREQTEIIKLPMARNRNPLTNSADYKATSLLHGLHTWKHKPKSRCHTQIDENRQKTESSSQTNADNDLPTNITSTELESFPTNPPALVHQKSYDANPVSTKGISSNAVFILTECRTPVDWCPSNLVQTFLRMIIAILIILAGSPVLVAGSVSTEQVTLQIGKPGVVLFHLSWPPRNASQVPHYTLRFESKPRPFSINGIADIQGFKSSSQISRFTISVTDLNTSPCVNLSIDNVDILDEGGYVLTVIWHSLENVWFEAIKKEIVVQFPPGRANCFLTLLRENNNYPYEVHCRAISGSIETTLSCYHNNQRIDFKHNITDNGRVTRGIFSLPDIFHFSCCSHHVTSNVHEKMCNDFEWPRGKEYTTQFVDTVNEQPETITTPQIESHTESGACRQFMLPPLWYFTYLFIYLLAFIITEYT